MAATPATTQPAFMRKQSPRRRRRGSVDIAFRVACALATLVAVGILVGLLFGILAAGLPRLNWNFITSFDSRFPERAGILASLMGSLWVIALTVAIAVPIGLAAAIYLEEFAKKNRLNEIIHTNIANLAGVPSIIYGLLGLALFVRWLALDRSIISGALTMSLLILPTVILTTREALRAVPNALREGSLALGATRWQTVRRQILPVALPSVLTGLILAVSRALGESAPLITVGAFAYIAALPTNVRDGFNVLPIQIFNWTSMPQKGFQDAAAAGIIVLLAVLLSMNSFAIILRSWQRKRLGS